MSSEFLREKWRECIEGYVEWLLSRNYSRVQVQSRAYCLSRFARIMISNGFGPGDVDFNVALKFVNAERVRKRPSSLKYEITVLRTFYDYLVKAGHAKINPFIDFRVKTGQSEIKALNEEELNRLLEAAYQLDPVKADALKFLAYTGLRISEFLMLSRGDIDLENKTMRVFNVKTDQVDVVPILKEAVEVLKRRSIEELNKFERTTYDKFIKKAALKAGLKKRVTIHTLRHTFVTMILSKTKDPLLTKQLARHASLHTTSRYLYQEVEDAKKKLENLNLT
ncbi:MAG: hypothetical protein DRJ30_06165 [Candidatus Methanomethylicota archaeon]|nr:MAG: hypothetical protein DRJ30_06165 [Candidatus Verstraetearchaeota archaeon]